MARGVNKVILIGNLGQDPDSRFTQQGSAVTTLSLATDESYKDKQTGQMVPKTEWHRIVLFNRLAEIAKEYLRKGSKVYIEGRLQTRKWQDQSGQDRYTTEIVGNELQMLDGRPADQGAPASAQQPSSAASQAGRLNPNGTAKSPYQNNGNAGQQGVDASGNPVYPSPSPEDFDDDIPF